MTTVFSNYKINKQHLYVVSIFLFYYLIHYLLLGYFTIRVEDLLDNEIVYNKIIGEFKELQRWKSTVTKALWGLYAAVTAWIVKILFW